jgi:hypothetical protein
VIVVSAALTAWGTLGALESRLGDPSVALGRFFEPDAAIAAPEAAITAPPVASSQAVAGRQDTLLLVVAEEGRAPSSLTVVAGPAEDGRATVLFIPTGTLVEIPGFGTERVGAALGFGGGELVLASIENALGIDVDHHVTVTPELLGDFLGRAGGLSVDVGARLVERSSSGAARVVFDGGTQPLDGARAAEYWTFMSGDEDEFDSLGRQQQIWSALSSALSSDETLRDRMLADGAPQLAPDGLAEEQRMFVADLFADLAAARESGELGFDLLPVKVFGASDGRQTYRLVDADADALVADRLALSRLEGSDGGRLRVQVLNGVGTPGIGRAIDQRLDGEPVRVVLTDNASDFDHPATRILVYDDNSAVRRAAERVRSRLGVGTIELSRQPQSVVDLTIVVGADFAPGQTAE